MFENYETMSADEKAQVKATHKALRTTLKKSGGRVDNLAWGFVRGFKYRRIERSTRTQTMPDGGVVYHNQPNPNLLTHLLGQAIPGFAVIGEKWWQTKADPRVLAWLADPEGAIAAPVREKKPYEKREVA